MTLSIPKELHRKMGRHPEFKWSEVARKAIEQKIREAELVDDLRAIAKARKENRENKTMTQKQLMKKLGIENEKQ